MTSAGSPDALQAKSLQISGITVSLNLPTKGSLYIKLVINGGTQLKHSFNANQLMLRWDIKPAFFLHEKSYLTIQLYERTIMRLKTIMAEESLSFDDAQRLLSMAAGDYHKLTDNPKITIDLTSSNGSHVDKLRTAVEALGERRTLLGRLGKSRRFLETLLSLGAAISELHPVAKAVLGCINMVYKRLEDQELRNKLILDLAENITQTLDYVEDVGQFARLRELKKAIEEVQSLVEGTTSFIIEYCSSGETSKAALSFLSSSDQDRVADLTARFERFKQRFDRGIAIQSAATLETALAIITSSHDDTIIAKLKLTDLECGSNVAECIPGTRQDILARINDWAADIRAPNILWLKGYPGVGKSAIASSLVEQLRDAMRLGSSFFFQRERAAVMTPNALWRTVAYDLARQYPTVRKRLVALLNEDETIPTTVNVDKLFRQLIREPLMTSEEIPIGRLPVIVIDALDECGGLYGQQSEYRVSLMQTLESWSRLSGKFKLVVTSRGENDIERLFSATSHHLLEISSGQAVDPQSSRDVRKFLENRFRQIVAQYPNSLPSDWPGRQIIEELTSRAAGLFIWAKTIVRFATRGEPSEQVHKILEGSGTGDMAALYSWILNASFPTPSEEVIKGFHSVLGAIILAKVPFSASSLTHLLSIKGTMMEYLCNGLQSVLESRGVLRINHQSFVDFLINQNQCPPDFFIDRRRENRNLTLVCLQIMKTQLRFNICDLKSSYFRNDDVPHLASRVEEHIAPYTSYSSCFWASHLAETTFDAEIFNGLQYFMRNLFLFWLEVLSLIRRVNLGSSMLRLLVDWIRTHGQDDAMAASMQKFVAAFASVIAQSVPHIYLSALPFAPRNSAVSKQYMEHYPQTLTIRSGGLSDWPAIQNVLSGHDSRVRSVAFSPDGTRIVSGSDDNTIRVWDVETGALAAGPFETPDNAVTSVSFSPDGRRIASGSPDWTVRVWDAETGAVAAGPFEGHEDWVRSVAFSPDGRRIVSGSDDKTIRVWDAETGALVVGPFKGHTSWIWSAVFSPDGMRIVSGSYDNTIRVWDAGMGEVIAGPFEGHNNSVNSVAFSPDGRRIVSGSFDRTIRVWDAETGAVAVGPLEGHDDSVNSVAFSPDGWRIVTGSSDNTIRVWDAETGVMIAGPFEGHDGWVRSVAFSPDGRRIVSGSYDQSIRVWDAEVSVVPTVPFESHGNWVNSIAFSPDGKRVISGSSDENIRVWDTGTGAIVVGPFGGHNNSVNSVALSPDGTCIASGSYDKTIRVWNAETGATVAGPLERHDNSVNSVAFSPDGRRIVSGSSDKTIRVWEAKTGTVAAGPFEGHEDWVRSVAFSPDGRRIVSGSSDETVRVWDAETGAMVAGPFEGHDNWVNSVVFSPDGRHVASGSYDKTIRVWDAETGAVVAGPFEGHEDWVRSVAFSPDGRRIVSGSDDKTVRVWDAETGVVVAGPFEGHEDWVRSVAFSPDGRCIASGSSDKTIRVWDAATGELVARPFEGHNNLSTCVTPSPSGRHIASGSSYITIQAWDTNTSDSIRQTVPSFSDSSKMEDGWIVGSNSELLFWVPPGIRAGLLRPGNISVMGIYVKTQLDLKLFVHGETWTLCKRRHGS